MSQISTQNPGKAEHETTKTMALAVYILYCVGFFTGITALAGLIIAYLKRDTADPVLASHFTFQIRTFWLGLLTAVVAVVLSLVIIGWFIAIWFIVWTLVRVIKGMMRLQEGRGIDDPNTWLW